MKVVFHEKPRLREPIMITGLPGMGLAAKQVVDYFIRELKAKIFGEVSSSYLAPAVVSFDKGIIKPIPDRTFRFYFKKSEEDSDMILFTGEYQPNSHEKQHELADVVAEVAENFNVKKLYTAAATPVGKYVEDPKIHGVATDTKSLIEMRDRGIIIMDEGAISGFNGLILNYAKARDIDAVCILGETYLVESIDVKAALALVEKLAELIGVSIDLRGIESAANEFDKRIQDLLKQYKREEKGPKYIY